jgi:hypothetical protein
MSNDDGSALSEENSLEGPDVEVPTEGADGAASEKADGLGQDGTIPNEPDGLAAGHTGEASNFEPEEDEDAD